MAKRPGSEGRGYVWVLGGGILQIPLINEAKSEGYSVIVSDRNPSCHAAPFADIFLLMDTFDVKRHVDEALRLKASEGLNICAVIAAGIDCTVTMAVLARVLDVPGVDPKAAYITNNKDLFRLHMQRHGFPCPRFHSISTDNSSEVRDAVKKVGFPLIVKNTDSSGGRGTRIFHEDTDIDEVGLAARNAIKASRSGRAVIEEVWKGTEHTVETIFDAKGRFHRLFITDRDFTYKDGYPVETGLRHPTRLSKGTEDSAYAHVREVAESLGITIGAAKADLIVTQDGPRIIELAVRLSGGFDCQFLVPHATGKNILRIALMTHLGKDFDGSLKEPRFERVGVTGSLWPGPGRVVSVGGEEEARRVKGVKEVFWRCAPGDMVGDYTDSTKRTCFVIATGSSEVSARESLKKGLNALRLDTEPV